MFRTMKKGIGAVPNRYGCDCPVCGARNVLDADLAVVSTCEHFVRRWRVTEDQRVRAEFRAPATVEG